MENKTVIYKGKVYQIGAPYLFSERDKEWVYGILTDVDCNYKKAFCTNEQVWDHIKEVPSGTNGTIKHAPLFLINGNAYMFDHHPNTDIIGVYQQTTKRMLTPHGHYPEGKPLNIREMTVKKGA